ncbi:MAG: hypothetical protein JWQ81_8472 [Amycolatopsis sp.]|uniref:hypothetical protein n=1 Tax=Amycolatopsis sp. TaxID=37632 RepID=UPI00260CFE34|nr:hypothetical protein [Amycolatopsis sp.]MCU1687733.1 hypothetical protein [Amycolatopsis sp.]
MSLRLFIARPLPGTVGETRRMVHVFPFPPGGAVPTRVTAFCGAEFGPTELELLDVPRGMPCEMCLRDMPRPDDELAGSS